MPNPAITAIDLRDLVIANELSIGRTILAGQNLGVGSVLGECAALTAAKALAGAGTAGANTGDGTLTLDVTTPVLAGAKPGVYKVRIVRPAVAQVGTTPVVPAQKALGQVIDPDGDVIGTFEIATSAGTTFENQIKFVMVEGSTPYIATDGWNITVTAAAKKLKLTNKANSDGSEVARYVLLKATDATEADVASVPVMKVGRVNGNKLVFGGASVLADHVEQLAENGIIAEAGAALAAADNA
jgi:hypothetical protein